MAEHADRRHISRRGFLGTLGLIASAGLIQACAPSAPAPGEARRIEAGRRPSRPSRSRPRSRRWPPPRRSRGAAGRPAPPGPLPSWAARSWRAGTDPGALDNNLDRGPGRGRCSTWCTTGWWSGTSRSRPTFRRSRGAGDPGGLADARVYTFKLRPASSSTTARRATPRRSSSTSSATGTRAIILYHKAGGGANALGFKTWRRSRRWTPPPSASPGAPSPTS